VDAVFVLIVIVVAAVVLGLPLLALSFAIVALSRASRYAKLEERLSRLESQLTGRDSALPAQPALSSDVAIVPEAEIVETMPPAEEPPPAIVPRAQAMQWELLIGQKALGWVAVVLGIFSAAFFLRYAYENNWIGPQGRVAIGEAIGLVLIVAGLRYHVRSWRVFAQMLTACGIVVLYLSTYSAFGFYRLLPQTQAGAFLAIIVALSLVAAVLYDSAAIAFVSIIGGFLSPLLLATEHDNYQAFFIYLAALNFGVALVTITRGWPGLGTVALACTQLLYWAWHAENYHPEKLRWALGFQAVVFLLYVSQDVGVQFRRVWGARWESSGRMVASATCWFAAFYVLLAPDYRAWMGSAALVMAVLYALIARRLLGFQGRYTGELLTAVALAVGFLALAIPLEARARWISLGWAACAAALWWLSARVRSTPLRVLSASLAAFSLGRLLTVDLDAYSPELVMPIFNDVALPSLSVTLILLAAIVAARSYELRFAGWQRLLTAATALAVLLMLWLVLSVDVYHYFDTCARLAVHPTLDWERLGQMSLSVLWTLYASTLLAAGFRWRVGGLRWLAIAFFGITVVKVLILDMAGLKQLYRIVAFLVLAVFLGLAARVYQRLGMRAGGKVSGEANIDATS
jgi:uncharacterized membrane protein